MIDNGGTRRGDKHVLEFDCGGCSYTIINILKSTEHNILKA